MMARMTAHHAVYERPRVIVIAYDNTSSQPQDIRPTTTLTVRAPEQ